VSLLSHSRAAEQWQADCDAESEDVAHELLRVNEWFLAGELTKTTAHSNQVREAFTGVA
jgi:hypothetical protein